MSLRSRFDYDFDRYDEAEAAQFAALMELKTRPHMERCPDCGYRFDALGHKNTCRTGRAA